MPMVVLFQENLLLGVDAARSIGEAGCWLEAGYTFAGAIDEYLSTESYLRLSAGLDYSFGSRLYGFFEYHLNGAGTGRSSRYLSRPDLKAYTEGAVYLLGRHYMAPGLTFQATPLLIFSAQTLVNAGDGSAFVSPRFEYGFAEDVFVEGGVFLGLGRGLKRGDAPLQLEPRSEFGLYPDIYFTSMRLYF